MPSKNPFNPELKRNRRFTLEEANEIRRKINAGELSISKASRIYDVNFIVIRKIMSNTTYVVVEEKESSK